MSKKLRFLTSDPECSVPAKPGQAESLQLAAKTGHNQKDISYARIQLATECLEIRGVLSRPEGVPWELHIRLTGKCPANPTL